MRIKARMGMSLDGYIATTDGTPALIKADGFVPGRSHGYPEFIDGCDAVLIGGPRTIQAVHREGALDSLEVIVLPVLLGDGIPLWPPGTPPPPLRSRREPRAFPDGSAELSYAIA